MIVVAVLGETWKYILVIPGSGTYIFSPFLDFLIVAHK